MTTRSLDKLHRDKLAPLRKSNQFFAHPSEIHEREGFNPRDYARQAMVEHIEGLKEAYKAGVYVPPIIVQVIDGTIYVRDGHCRRLAMVAAMEEGVDIGQQPLIEFKGDESEADALIVNSQAGAKLTPLEIAQVCQRMENRGKTKSEIAKLIGKTPQRVADLLAIHTLPDRIKQMIQSEQVAASTALQAYNENGEAAIELLVGAADDIEPGKKVTPKHVKAKAPAKPKAPPKPTAADTLIQLKEELEGKRSVISGEVPWLEVAKTIERYVEELS